MPAYFIQRSEGMTIRRSVHWSKQLRTSLIMTFHFHTQKMFCIDLETKHPVLPEALGLQTWCSMKATILPFQWSWRWSRNYRSLLWASSLCSSNLKGLNQCLRTFASFDLAWNFAFDRQEAESIGVVLFGFSRRTTLSHQNPKQTIRRTSSSEEFWSPETQWKD